MGKNEAPCFDLVKPIDQYAANQRAAQTEEDARQELASFQAFADDMSKSVHLAIVAIKNITGSPLAVKQLLAEIASMCANHEFESAHDMSGVIEHLDMAQDECDRITDADADQKRQRAFERSPVAVARLDAFTEACKSIDGAVGVVL